MSSLTHSGITWYDDPSPTEQEILKLQKQYGFHELDVEDCLSMHERPKIEEYDEYLFLVFHIPYLTKQGRVAKEEVNIFLAQEYIVTLHEGRIPILDILWRQLQTSEEKRKQYLERGTGYFLYELMHHLFEDLFPIVDTITRELRRMEDELFENEEEIDLLRDIMTIKRDIISLRAILLPQRTLIAAIEHKNKQFIPDWLSPYFDDVLDAIERQWALLETAKETIDALQSTHESWLSHRTSSIVKVLTIFSVTMLPLTFITGLYGMNVHLPFQAESTVFLGIVGLMVLLLLMMLFYFWHKHWLK